MTETFSAAVLLFFWKQADDQAPYVPGIRNIHFEDSLNIHFEDSLNIILLSMYESLEKELHLKKDH